MKEFILTQPYTTIEEMVNSGELSVYKEELQQGNIEKYAIVSRIGNRYDIEGKKIEDYATNPFLEVAEEVEKENNVMKYQEIEMLIDKEIEQAIAEVNAKYEAKLKEIKEAHEYELFHAKEQVKNELIAKLNA